MSKKIVTQKSFTSGELSPLAQFRSEAKEYAAGLNDATNIVLDTRGGMQKRPGSKFLSKLKNSAEPARLLKWQYDKTLAYTLEFTNQAIRFYSPTGLILSSTTRTVTNITESSAGVTEVTTSVNHGYTTGDVVFISGVVSNYNAINSTTAHYVITATPTLDTFRFSLDLPVGFTYTSGGTISTPYTLTSPYLIADVPLIQTKQVGTVLHLVHPSYAPRTLERISNTSWELNTVTFYPEPTYEAGYAPALTLTPGATTGTSVSFTASGAVFLAGDIGRQLINLAGNGRASIKSITSTTVAVADIVEAFPSTSAIASGDWKLDLSPIADLKFSGLEAGSVVTVRSYHNQGSFGPARAISGITAASPGVVTTATHGYVDGQNVQLDDVVGMTQVNGKVFTIDVLSGTTFSISQDTSAYTPYASDGIARRVMTNVALDVFRAADVGKYILANGGVLKIITVTSATTIEAEVIKTLNSLDATGQWTLEDPTWTSTRGYPSTVGLFQSRLWYGGTSAQPLTIWGSEIGLYDSFGVGPDDEDSIELTLTGDGIGKITWMSAARDLVIGTNGAEITVSSNTASSLTPSSAEQFVRTYNGSEPQQVAAIKSELVYIQGSGTKIRTFGYDYSEDGYRSEDTMLIADHLGKQGIVELAYAQEPNSTIYAVSEEGQLLVGIYDRSREIAGWTKYVTDGYYESVQCLSQAGSDLIYVVVNRLINGSNVRSVEQFHTGNGLIDTDGYVDSYTGYSVPVTVTSVALGATTVFTTATHSLTTGDTIVLKDSVDPLAADLDLNKELFSSLNGTVYKVVVLSSTTFRITDEDDVNISTADYNSYSSGGKIYKRITNISNLRHIEGKICAILGDGAVQVSKTVVDGSITLESPAGEVVIGLPYSMDVTTLPNDFDIGLGSMQGQIGKWSKLQLYVHNSSKPNVNLELLPSRESDDLMDVKPGLVSGYLVYGPIPGQSDLSVNITSSEPLPVNVLGITGIIESGLK